MSRIIQRAMLCLVVVGVAAPMAAQTNNVSMRQYLRSEVTKAEFPEAVLCGESFNVDVTVKNVARARWTEAASFKLGPTMGEDEAFRPDGRQFAMPDGTSVPYSGEHTFSLELTAPMERGNYETQWSMMTNGVPFGAPVEGKIRVTCDDSSLARAKFPEEVECGESFTVEVRMKNSGVSTWKETEFYKLGPVEKTNEVFRIDGHKFKMPDFTEVGVGEIYSFELELLAPGTPGTYPSKWTMMRKGKAFGEEVSRTIAVRCKKGFRGKDGRD